MQKAVGGHFELAVWIDVTSINISCFFTIIKTVSISCNWSWTDQLLFTYKMALCTSHSHSFVCGWSIVIKFTYLTDIPWKIQQNMHGRFLEIPVFLGVVFLCRTLYTRLYYIAHCTQTYSSGNIDTGSQMPIQISPKISSHLPWPNIYYST